jgi:hypothetical protein
MVENLVSREACVGHDFVVLVGGMLLSAKPACTVALHFFNRHLDHFHHEFCISSLQTCTPRKVCRIAGSRGRPFSRARHSAHSTSHKRTCPGRARIFCHPQTRSLKEGSRNTLLLRPRVRRFLPRARAVIASGRVTLGLRPASHPGVSTLLYSETNRQTHGRAL